ncbi:MAG: hypothetical protein ACYDCN_10280 [Bacteroidia bacterium]
MDKEKITTILEGKKWVAATDAGHLSYHFRKGNVTILPSKEECEYMIHEVIEPPNTYRMDIFRAKVTEVYNICAISDSHVLLANNTADEKLGAYKILRLVSS